MIPAPALFTPDLPFSHTLASVPRLFAAGILRGMLLSLLQEHRAGLSRIPGGSVPRRSLALLAVFNGLGYKKLGCWEPPLWLVKASPNNELQTGPCGSLLCFPNRLLLVKAPRWKQQRSEGEAMKVWRCSIKRPPHLIPFPRNIWYLLLWGA